MEEEEEEVKQRKCVLCQLHDDVIHKISFQRFGAQGDIAANAVRMRLRCDFFS